MKRFIKAVRPSYSEDVVAIILLALSNRKHFSPAMIFIDSQYISYDSFQMIPELLSISIYKLRDHENSPSSKSFLSLYKKFVMKYAYSQCSMYLRDIAIIINLVQLFFTKHLNSFHNDDFYLNLVGMNDES